MAKRETSGAAVGIQLQVISHSPSGCNLFNIAKHMILSGTETFIATKQTTANGRMSATRLQSRYDAASKSISLTNPKTHTSGKELATAPH